MLLNKLQNRLPEISAVVAEEKGIDQLAVRYEKGESLSASFLRALHAFFNSVPSVADVISEDEEMPIDQLIAGLKKGNYSFR